MRPGPACEDSGNGWVFPGPTRSLQHISNFADFDALGRWAERNNGVPRSGNIIVLTLQGINGRVVVGEQFGVHVVERRSPIQGVVPDFYRDCGGVTHAYFEADLDQQADDLSPIPRPGGGIDESIAPIVPLPHQVSGTEIETWQLMLTTTKCDCMYVPYVDWSSAGRAGRLPLTLGNRPWEITAPDSQSTFVMHNPTNTGWAPDETRQIEREGAAAKHVRRINAHARERKCR